MTAWGAGWVEAASRCSSWRGPRVKETLPCLPECSPQWVSEPGVKAQIVQHRKGNVWDLFRCTPDVVLALALQASDDSWKSTAGPGARG